MIYYFIIKKAFRFLIEDYNYSVYSKTYYGYYEGVEYKNEKMKIAIYEAYNRINIEVCHVKSEESYYDSKVYYNQFKCDGNFRKKAIEAAKWLKLKLVNNETLI